MVATWVLQFNPPCMSLPKRDSGEIAVVDIDRAQRADLRAQASVLVWTSLQLWYGRSQPLYPCLCERGKLRKMRLLQCQRPRIARRALRLGIVAQPSRRMGGRNLRETGLRIYDALVPEMEVLVIAVVWIAAIEHRGVAICELRKKYAVSARCTVPNSPR